MRTTYTIPTDTSSLMPTKPPVILKSYFSMKPRSIVAKIAISLPDEVLQAVEKERLASGQSRSEFFRNAVEAFLRQRRDRELEEPGVG